MGSVNFDRSTGTPTTVPQDRLSFRKITGNFAELYVGSNSDVPIKVTDSDKQPTLVSGTNIKTVNGNSLLGSGNVVIAGTTLAGFVSASDYITDFTGGSDQSTQFNSLVTYAQDNNKIINFPANTIVRIDATINFKVGKDATNKQFNLVINGNGLVIKPTGAIVAMYGDPLCAIADTTTGKEHSHVELRSITFDGGAATTGATGIRIGKTGYFSSAYGRRIFENLSFFNYGFVFNAMDFINFRQVFISNVKSERGFLALKGDSSLSDPAKQASCGDMFISGSDFEGVYAYATGTGAVTGLHFDNVNFYRTTSLVSPTITLKVDSSTSQMRDCWFNSVQLDDYTDDTQPAILLDQSGSGKLFQMYFNNMYFSGFGSRMIYANAANVGKMFAIRIADNIIQFDRTVDNHDLYNFNNVTNITFTDNQIFDVVKTGAGESMVNFTGCSNVLARNNNVSNSTGWDSFLKFTNCSDVSYGTNVLGSIVESIVTGTTSNFKSDSVYSFFGWKTNASAGGISGDITDYNMVWDNDGAMNATTGVYTVPITGRYTIEFDGFKQDTAQFTEVRLYKNGVAEGIRSLSGVNGSYDSLHFKATGIFTAGTTLKVVCTAGQIHNNESCYLNIQKIN